MLSILITCTTQEALVAKTHLNGFLKLFVMYTSFVYLTYVTH